ncbi:MAG: DUF3553 domain-containing protein [Rhodobacterales bacterium]|nr:MAG: DUF3553 domain-containing protein [Rhodobacterales bacterium]
MSYSSFFAPGMIVRHPKCPEWGEGQVQSVIGSKVTVMFRDVGKQVVDTAHVELDLVSV